MASKAFKQSLPAAGLSLERATENVPDDGRFHLILNGKIINSFRSEKVAQVEYQALRKAYLDEHPPDKTKVDFSEIVRMDQDRVSNKELIWGEEDFLRVQRMTGKPRRRR